MKAQFYIALTIIILLAMSVSLTESVVADIIAILAAISGWIAFIYQYFSERPKIRGKILQVMRGTSENPDGTTESPITVFTLFLYLTNMRKNAVHVSDYILEVETEAGFEKMKTIYGIGETRMHFYYGTGEIEIPDFNKGLIYKQSKPIEFGTPLYGYLPFAGDHKYFKANIKSFRITCVDVFGHEHKITTRPKDFVNLIYLQEVFGIKIPDT